MSLVFIMKIVKTDNKIWRNHEEIISYHNPAMTIEQFTLGTCEVESRTILREF